MDRLHDEMLSVIRCPLGGNVMRNPVIVLEDFYSDGVWLQKGLSYDRDSLKVYPSACFKSNVNLAGLIEDYQKNFKSKLE